MADARDLFTFTCRISTIAICLNAEAFLRHLNGDRYEVESFGTLPTERNPLATRAMADWDVDISGHRSNSLDELRGAEFDLVVTVSRSDEGGLPLISRQGREGPPELPRHRNRHQERGGAYLSIPGGEGRDRGLDRGEAGVRKRAWRSA